MASKIHSSYWLDTDSINSLVDKSTVNPIQLSKYQKAISNFVRILTKKSIPVKYKTSGNSYTDSKEIVIGSNISNRNFDSVVGLALHEASHIKLTDFKVWYDFKNLLLKNNFNQEFVDKISSNTLYYKFLRDLTNYIEDRRIDLYVYQNSPGYKDYYVSLYNRYFNSSHIDKGLKSSEYRDSTIESYMFRIMNLTNPNSDLSALPDLDVIYNLIFSSVRSLESTSDSVVLAAKVFEIATKHIENNEDAEGGDNKNEESESNISDDQNSDGAKIQVKIDADSSNDDTSSNNTPPIDLTETQKKSLDKWVDKQKDFLNGDISKKNLSKTNASIVESISKSDFDIVQVQYNDQYSCSDEKDSKDVVVLKGINQNTLNLLTHTQYMTYSGTSFQYHYDIMERIINEGILLGKRLGKKLQIRNSETDLIYNRKKKGKIEKRRLYSVGTGDYDIFYDIKTEKHEDAFLHLSIDCSGSMSGQPFYNSIKSAVAIAQMASMTNIDVQISTRFVDSFSRSNIGKSNHYYPVMWIVYDSRVDDMNYVKRNFKYLIPQGSTPEGLCFASIMGQLPTGSDALKTYFINYSDGLPNYGNYGGSTASVHTHKEVKRMKSKGYSILSFFIGTDVESSAWKTFQYMYGKDNSTKIDTTSIIKLASELQKMFSEK